MPFFVRHIRLRNWRNFLQVDQPLQKRMFLVGPNASGKSNFLEAFRFLKDIASSGGGLQKALDDRGGLPKVRCLAARQDPKVLIDIELQDTAQSSNSWRYALEVSTEERGRRRPLVYSEKVWKGSTLIRVRPDEADRNDPEQRTQTHLEQIGSNQAFREIASFIDGIQYLHLIPQLVQHQKAFTYTNSVQGDPYGRNLLDRIAATAKKDRASRLSKINKALRVAVPSFSNLTFVQEEGTGTPHLEATYKHWRPNAGKQREDQFSDGTLRLIGLLWSLLGEEGLVLLEEPELSLNAGIVKHLPSLIYRAQASQNKQIIVSTHSYDLLTDRGIGPEEVLLLQPGQESTEVRAAKSIQHAEALLQNGLSLAEILQPLSEPKDVNQLSLFD